jgi:hypothetical protein
MSRYRRHETPRFDSAFKREWAFDLIAMRLPGCNDGGDPVLVNELITFGHISKLEVAPSVLNVVLIETAAKES